jgi:hypothetical protein
VIHCKHCQNITPTGDNKLEDKIRYDLFTEFLEEYKMYFDNNIKIEESEEEIIIIPKKKSMKLKQKKEPVETTVQRTQRTKSELSVLHQRYKTLNSQNLQKEFKETPELWYKYHSISEENEKSFPEDEIPRNRIIQELVSRFMIFTFDGLVIDLQVLLAWFETMNYKADRRGNTNAWF